MTSEYISEDMFQSACIKFRNDANSAITKNAFIHPAIHPIIHLFSHYILNSSYVLGTENKKMKETDTAWNLAETRH